MPCIIRRAALGGKDTTSYQIDNLEEYTLSSKGAEGKQIRSLQYATDRIKKAPNIAKLLIHKPGSLSDVQDELQELEDIYIRGLYEVDKLLNNVRTKYI